MTAATITEVRHRAIVGEIQRLMQVYQYLSPEVQKEILRFLKTPEMVTNINFKSLMHHKTTNNKNGEAPLRIINFYVV